MAVTCKNCYASGSVKGNTYAGGFVGVVGNTAGSLWYIRQCYSSGNVEGDTGSEAGGFVAWLYGDAIDCYARGDVVVT
jgi:hypothetical protein